MREDKDPLSQYGARISKAGAFLKKKHGVLVHNLSAIEGMQGSPIIGIDHDSQPHLIGTHLQGITTMHEGEPYKANSARMITR